MSERWLTCTPVCFLGDASFFRRDSGLMCRGLQAAGVDCQAVMPGPAQPEDVRDLLRVDAADLRSEKWWRQTGACGVVLYAWGSPRYFPVARAIRRAGIFLVLNQDSGGLVSPLAGVREWWDERRRVAGAVSGVPWRGRFLRGALRELTVGLALVDPMRAAHLRQGDVIAAVSPRAAEHYRRLCRVYGGEKQARRVKVIPHPVNPIFRCGEGRRQRRVIAVGRWDDVRQKRTGMMCRVLERVLKRDGDVKAVIVGRATEELRGWQAGLSPGVAERVELTGRLEHGELAERMASSQVLYCSSAYESFHIASGEALCSGCSVVAAKATSLASFGWFAGEGCGTLAKQDDEEGHVAALMEEMKAWDEERRNAGQISRLWQARLNAAAVAGGVVALRAR